MKSAILAASFAFAVFAAASFAADDQTNNGHDQHHAADAKTFPGHGMVNSVDIAAGKVNLSHDAIKALRWPKMTMDFTVHDPAGLKDLKPGMEVDFELTKIAGTYQITKITPTSK